MSCGQGFVSYERSRSLLAWHHFNGFDLSGRCGDASGRLGNAMPWDGECLDYASSAMAQASRWLSPGAIQKRGEEIIAELQLTNPDMSWLGFSVGGCAALVCAQISWNAGTNNLQVQHGVGLATGAWAGINPTPGAKSGKCTQTNQFWAGAAWLGGAYNFDQRIGDRNSNGPVSAFLGPSQPRVGGGYTHWWCSN